MRLLIAVLSLVGFAGNLALIPTLWRLYRALRHERQFGSILAEAALTSALVLSAALLYVVARYFGWLGEGLTRDAVLLALMLAFAIKPWVFRIRLWRWGVVPGWWQRRRDRRRDRATRRREVVE